MASSPGKATIDRWQRARGTTSASPATAAETCPCKGWCASPSGQDGLVIPVQVERVPGERFIAEVEEMTPPGVDDLARGGVGRERERGREGVGCDLEDRRRFQPPRPPVGGQPHGLTGLQEAQPEEL